MTRWGHIPGRCSQFSHSMQNLSLAWQCLRQAWGWLEQAESLLPLQIIKDCIPWIGKWCWHRRNHLPLVLVREKASVLIALWTLKIPVQHSCQKIHRVTVTHQRICFLLLLLSPSLLFPSILPPALPFFFFSQFTLCIYSIYKASSIILFCHTEDQGKWQRQQQKDYETDFPKSSKTGTW